MFATVHGPAVPESGELLPERDVQVRHVRVDEQRRLVLLRHRLHRPDLLDHDRLLRVPTVPERRHVSHPAQQILVRMRARLHRPTVSAGGEPVHEHVVSQRRLVLTSGRLVQFQVCAQLKILFGMNA